ncbi:hypothetical protein C8Q80DRAFT_688925 [Daedaleopsis nitida]|nr:hypothetical protein C8Q80DRAFT_688925 [Daedaleopsis nitida]
MSLQRKTSTRLRKLSDTIRNVVAPKSEKYEPRRRPSTRDGQPVSKEDIRIIKPEDDIYGVHRKASSMDDILYRSTPAPSRPHKLHRPHPSLEDRPRRPMAPIVIPPPSSSNSRQDRPRLPHANTVPDRLKAGHSSRDPRKKEKPVPIPFPIPSASYWDASPAPPRPPANPRTPFFTPFARSSSQAQQPKASGSRSAKPPAGSSTPASADVWMFPTLSPSRERTPQLERSASLPRSALRESVYCSTGAATVRRQGAIRRTSSSGEANLPPMHSRYRPERTADKEARREAERSLRPQRTLSPRTLPPPKPEPKGELPVPPNSIIFTGGNPSSYPKPELLPQVKPLPRGVPHDVSPDASSESAYTETPRSSLMLIPPAPVATPSVVAKLQANMNVKESSAPRAVQVSDPGLHRAASHRVQIEGGSASRTAANPALSASASKEPAAKAHRGARPKRTVEVFGLEIGDFDLERARAWQEEQLALSTPAGRGSGPAARAGSRVGAQLPTRPLVIRKDKGKGVEADRGTPKRRGAQ